MNNPSFRMSADARLLVAFMKAVPVGTTVTDAQLKDAIGGGEVKHAIYTAMHRLTIDERIVFSRVRGVGYMRLDNSSIVSSGVADRERIRRAASRAIKKQFTVVYEDLDNPTKQLWTAQVSLMSTIAALSKERAVLKVSAAASSYASKEIPMTSVINMFKKDSTDEQA